MYDHEKEEVIRNAQSHLVTARLFELFGFCCMGANMALFGTDIIVHKQLTGCSIMAVVCLMGFTACLQLSQRFVRKAGGVLEILKPKKDEEGK